MNEPKEQIFTTEPKIQRRRNQASISGNRCRIFMEYLWRHGLKTECEYQALKVNFIICFETNDVRTITKYIGRPKLTVTYEAKMFRQKTNAGESSTARFYYDHTKTQKAKKGLMEYLGYIGLDKDTGHVILHHETFDYYTTQIQLPPASPLQEDDECVRSKEDLCACPIGLENKTDREVVERALAGSYGEVEKKEEEEGYKQRTRKRSLENLYIESLTEPEEGS